MIIMKIKRVDEKTVKCFLSNEELEAYEIEYKDFIMHSDKAKQVVQDVLEQAAVEVGYKPPKFAFDLQIMVLQDQGILLTFSESDALGNHVKNLLDCLKAVQQKGQNPKEILGMEEMLEELSNQVTSVIEEKQEVSQEIQKPSVAKSNQAIFVFESIRDVMSYAGALPGTLRVQSALYEMGGQYYLCLHKGSAAYERFSRACIQAMEFARLYSAQPGQMLLLEEHGKCLIADKAIQKLRG